MTEIKIYHNPRCSKSRQTLQLLQDNNITPEIILYLESPPTKTELKDLLEKLGISARDLLRTSEQAYKEAGLSDTALSENQLLQAMVTEPKLIQRPIVVAGDKAVLGRPPENALELIQ
ncbi:arsenate reductase (glutaredoxin) [Gammaproteobacteria bacterium]|jgi:arsenate reductase|nr:arsenate reductase (glutaredoxin) [Gammaproteobacteria bacterium]